MAGWDVSGKSPSNVFCIHHPSGDAKKISIYNGTCRPTSWLEYPKQYHWEVPQWTHGVTEPGSSGAALFDSKGLVVGHLHGGQSSCPRPLEYDKFGALHIDWNTAPSVLEQLKSYLNPDGLKITSIQGNYLQNLRASRHKNKK